MATEGSNEDIVSCVKTDWDKWTIFSKTITVVYALICILYSLIMRFYLHSHYTSAFVAGWGVVVTAFVLWDNVCQIKNSLGCSIKVFTKYQVVLNAVYFTCTILMVVGYTVLTAISLHIDYDYAMATALSSGNALFMFYMFLISIISSRNARSTNYALRKSSLAWNTHMDTNGYELETAYNSDSHMVHNNYIRSEEMTHGRCCGSSCKDVCIKIARFLWRLCVAVFYYPIMVVMLLLFIMSMCHPYFVIVDTLRYREPAHMYTVEVTGHRPLSLFMKCTGSGNTTLVYENGLGGLAYMEWDFMPQMLKDRYTVCVHDRRGYGWSEGANHDYLQLLWKQPQWSKTNSEFFIKLVEVANIKTPFYYIGHSYGGSHLMYTFKQNPAMIKGLIFLDSVEFNAGSLLQQDLALIINLRPSGIFYVLLNSGLFNYKTALDNIGDFSQVSQSTLDHIISSIRSSTYLESYLREWNMLTDTSSPYNTHPSVISSLPLADVPTLVIDRSDRKYWFPSDNFKQYNTSSFYAQVPGTTHTTLVYNMNKTKITSQIIDHFVKYTEGDISFNEYTMQNQNILSK